MVTKKLPLVLFFVVAGIALLAQLADAGNGGPPDLTGTWDGKATCKGLFQGDKTSDKFEGDLTITQVGSDLNMEFFGVRYNGAIQQDNKDPTKKGEGTFVACSTVNDYSAYSEMGAMKVKIDAVDDTKSSFKATSVFSTATDNFQSCKWSFKRADPGDPGVGDCD